MMGWGSRLAARLGAPPRLIARRARTLLGAGRRSLSAVTAVAVVVATAVAVTVGGAGAASAAVVPLLNPAYLGTGVVVSGTGPATGNPSPQYLYSATNQQLVALDALEQQAITNTLSDHGLPASDAEAVTTWARPDAEAELWGLLVQAIQTSPSSRTANQQNAVAWLTGVVQRQQILAATDAGQQYAQWAGIGSGPYASELLTNPSESALATFLSANPVPYANGGSFSDPSASTNGGYCVYTPPAPDQSQYTANIYTPFAQSTAPQTCFTACTNVAGCAPSTPTYNQFVGWGAAQAEGEFDSPAFVAQGNALAQGIALGAGAAGAVTAGAVTGSALAATGALQGTALATALAPYGGVNGGAVGALGSDALAEASASIAASEIGGVVAIVITALVTAVLEGIQVVQAAQLPDQIASLVTNAVTAPAPDLATMLGSASSGALLFDLFAGVAQPGPVADTLTAPSSADLTFTITAKGASTSTQSTTLAWEDKALDTTNSAYAFPYWFVQTEKASDGSSVTYQTLELHYTDWSGTERIAWLAGNAQTGYEFLVVANNPSPPVDPSTCLSDGTCAYGPSIEYVGTNGQDYTATLSGSTGPSGTGIPPVPPPTTGHSPASLTLTASPASPAVGQPVTFTAVFGSSGPSGTVNFVSDLNGHDTTLCSAAPVTTVEVPKGQELLLVPEATCTATFQTAQSPTVYATFYPAPEDLFSAGQASLAVHVTAAAATTTAVAASVASPVVGQPVKLTATVSDGSGPAPTGTVTFSDTSGKLCSAVPLTSAAPYTATCTYTPAAPGQVTVTADYSGASGTKSSSGSAGVTAVQASTAVKEASAPTAPLFGQSVTFTATVAALAPSTGHPAPTGTVRFAVDGGTASQPVAVTAAGTATSAPVTGLTPGAHTVVATYSGDGNYKGATVTLPVTVGCSTTVTSTSHGALKVTGATCVQAGGTVAGPVTVEPGGALALLGATQNGGITVDSGGTLLVSHSTVNGVVSVRGAAAVTYCGSVQHGNLTVTGAGRVTLGSGSCAASTIRGAVAVTGSSGPVSVAGLSQNGGLTISGNTGGLTVTGLHLSGLVNINDNTGTAPVTVAGNSVQGSLTCAGNTPPPTDGGTVNTVSGTASGQCTALATRG